MSPLLWTGGLVFLIGWFFWLPYQLKPHMSEGWIIAITFAPMPLSVLMGSLFLVLTRVLGGSLIVRSSSVLSGAAKVGLGFLRSDPQLLLLPGAGSLAIAVTLALTAVLALGSSPSSVPEAAALEVVFSAPAFGAYLLCGFILFLTNAAVIHYYLQSVKGRPSLARALGAALRRAPSILVLSLAVFLGLTLLNRLVRPAKAGEPGSPASTLLDFAAISAEAGVFLGANLVLAAMFAGETGLAEGARRAAAAARSRPGASLSAVFGMATFRHEAPCVLIVGFFGAGMLCAPYFAERAHPLLGAAVGFAIGLILASSYAAVLQALEALFAAAIFGGESSAQPLRRALALLDPS